MDSIFLKGVIETANQAVETTQKILNLFTEEQKNIEAIGKPPTSTLIMYRYLQKHPITDSKKTVGFCKMTLPTTNKSLHHLADLGIIKEITGKARNKIYVYQKYLDILSDGAGPINE